MTSIEGQKPITDSMYLINRQRDERKTGQGVLGKDDFMKLLIAQLQNQDPTNPMKDNEFIAQMAQFSALEQTMNLSKAFEKFAEAQNQTQLIQYNQFVGKTVRYHIVTDEKDQDGKPVVQEGTGSVQGIKFVDGSIRFIMQDGKELSPGNISEVLSSSQTANHLVEASRLIGKKVSFLKDNEELTKTVVSVSTKEGKLEYILDDGSRVTSESFISISQ